MGNSIPYFAPGRTQQCINYPHSKRITLFFDDSEYEKIEWACHQYKIAARPLIKRLVIDEIDKQRERDRYYQ